MTISSRTPEGVPHKCPVCGQESATDPSFPGGDSTCPSCGHLLWWFQDRLSATSGLLAGQIRLDTPLESDSLGIVELAVAIEEEFGVSIPDEEAERMKAVEDVIRYIAKSRG